MNIIDFKVGDRVCGEEKHGKPYTGTIRFIGEAVHVERDDGKKGGGKNYGGRDIWRCSYYRKNVMSDGSNGIPLELENKCHGGKQMELKNIKETNLKIAKKQFEEEQTNEEVRWAKSELQRAQNEINRIDRGIKAYEAEKKPYLEIVAKFK